MAGPSREHWKLALVEARVERAIRLHFDDGLLSRLASRVDFGYDVGLAEVDRRVDRGRGDDVSGVWEHGQLSVLQRAVRGDRLFGGAEPVAVADEDQRRRDDLAKVLERVAGRAGRAVKRVAKVLAPLSLALSAVLVGLQSFEHRLHLGRLREARGGGVRVRAGGLRTSAEYLPHDREARRAGVEEVVAGVVDDRADRARAADPDDRGRGRALAEAGDQRAVEPERVDQREHVVREELEGHGPAAVASPAASACVGGDHVEVLGEPLHAGGAADRCRSPEAFVETMPPCSSTSGSP